MTCVTFFKSTLSEVQCNAAIFLGKQLLFSWLQRRYGKWAYIFSLNNPTHDLKWLSSPNVSWCNHFYSLGFLLGNLPENKRLTISKEYVCGGECRIWSALRISYRTNYSSCRRLCLNYLKNSIASLTFGEKAFFLHKTTDPLLETSKPTQRIKGRPSLICQCIGGVLVKRFGNLLPVKFGKFGALKCHFLHSEHKVYSSYLTLRYLYFMQKLRKIKILINKKMLNSSLLHVTIHWTMIIL
jgi:hypothetical protein